MKILTSQETKNILKNKQRIYKNADYVINSPTPHPHVSDHHISHFSSKIHFACSSKID